MQKINVLIVEDELLIAQNLKLDLEDHNFLVNDVVTSGEEAINSVSKNQPDLILMDIHLSGNLDGIATILQLKEKYEIPVIYLSDHIDDATVERAKKTYPAGYLSKPFKTSDVLRTLEIAFVNNYKKKSLASNSGLNDRIFIRTSNQKSKMIAYEDILYLEADRAYSAIVTEERTYTLSNNMRKIFEQIKNPDFVRAHRSYVININRITGIDGNMIELGNKHIVHMSNNYRDDIMSKINLVK